MRMNGLLDVVIDRIIYEDFGSATIKSLKVYKWFYDVIWIAFIFKILTQSVTTHSTSRPRVQTSAPSPAEGSCELIQVS